MAVDAAADFSMPLERLMSMLMQRTAALLIVASVVHHSLKEIRSFR